MATPVVESTDGNKSQTTSVTVTAPTGITTGDLLVGSFTAFRSVGAVGADTPTGWTAVETGGSSKTKVNTFFKVAVLADESEVNYTFTATDAEEMEASILRISGAVSGSEITVSDLNTRTGDTSLTVSHTTTATPPTAESLIIICAGNGNFNIAAPVTTSKYTSTPTVTWTEQYDDGYQNGLSDGSSHAVATAPYSGTTQFTDYGYLLSENGEVNGNVGVLLIVSSPEDTTGTVSLLGTNPTVNNANATSSTAGTSTLLTISPILPVSNGEGIAPTAWTPISKS